MNAPPRRLIALLVAFAVLNSTAWSLLVPPGHAPDEQAHMKVASYVAAERDLPIFGRTEGFGVEILNVTSTRSQEVIYTYSSYAAQPPLPYVLAAVLIALPTDSVWMDYHQARGVQALLAGAFALVMFLGTRAIFPTRPELAVAATFLGSLWPQITYLGAYFNADMAATVLSAALIAMWFVGTRTAWTPRVAGLTGILLGLGMLAKLNVWFVMAFTAVVALLTLVGPVRTRLHRVGIATLGMLLVAGPWLALAASRYGTDLLANDRRNELAAKLNATPLDAASSNWSYLHMLFGGHWLENVGRTFVIGVPGHLTTLDELVVPIALVLLAIAGGVLALVRGRRDGLRRRMLRRSAVPFIACALLMVALFAATSYNAFKHDIYFLGQGRYLFPMLLPLFAFVVAGIAALSSVPRRQSVLLASVCALMLALNVWVLRRAIISIYSWTMPQYYDSWQVVLLVAWLGVGIALVVLAGRYWWGVTRTSSDTARDRRIAANSGPVPLAR